MIRLITQFDDPTKRVTISTPTCCCSCCCCCITSIATSSAITYLNLNNISKNTGQKTQKKPNFIYSITGLFLLPLLLGIAYYILYLANFYPELFYHQDVGKIWIMLLIGLPLTWAIALTFLYNKVGAGGRVVAYTVITVFLTILGFILEIYCIFAFFTTSCYECVSINWSSYLLFAAIFTVVAIITFKLHIDKML